MDSIRRLFGRAEQTLTEADYAALGAVHQAEDRLDDATSGRFYDAVERADEEAGELLERLHLDGEPFAGETVQEGATRDAAESSGETAEPAQEGAPEPSSEDTDATTGPGPAAA